MPTDPAPPAEVDAGVAGADPRRSAPAAGGSNAVVVTGDGSRTLLSGRYGETFRSRHGAHAEARHVFVDGTGVGRRLTAGHATAVLEVGLGAATNLVWTVAAALAGDAPLRYQVWEPDPLPADAWAALRHEDVIPAAALASLLTARASWGRPSLGAVHVWRHGLVRVEVIVAPIAGMLDDAVGAPSGDVHAVYLDPFSPAVNPDAWTSPVLSGLAGRLCPGGVLASYTVAGAVRRALMRAGLEVAKVPGPPGGKREVLLARRPRAAVEGASGAAHGDGPPQGAGA